MLEYVDEIKRGFIEQYGFEENPELPGVPKEIPDGEYPMIISGRIDRVKVSDGKLSFGRFEDEKPPFHEVLVDRVKYAMKNITPPLTGPERSSFMRSLQDGIGNRVLQTLLAALEDLERGYIPPEHRHGVADSIDGLAPNGSFPPVPWIGMDGALAVQCAVMLGNLTRELRASVPPKLEKSAT